MTVSYNLDISTANSFGFYKILFKWRGSIWKTTSWEFLSWTVCYYTISILYRFAMPPEVQSIFGNLSKHLDKKLEYLPLVLLLGFFVKIVFDRWKGVFDNVGFIDAAAFTACTYIRGDDEKTILARRSILRYCCLTQVLVLRDVSVKVRQRFPTLDAVVMAGFLQPHEKEYLNKYKSNYDRYWVPMAWAAAAVYNLRQEGKISSDTLYNNIIFEINAFQKRLQGLCYNDWVPVPLAYPQIVFMCTRIFMVVCLVSRQFLVHPGEKNGNTIDAVIPFMTMLQIFFYLAWTKVAEELLNPLGTDDDDLETNYIIDRNISMAMMLAEDYYNQFPEQILDKLDPKNPPVYEETSMKPSHPYKGSAVTLNLKIEGRRPSMVPHRYSISKDPKKNSLKTKTSLMVFSNSNGNSMPVKIERSLSFPMAYRTKNQELPQELKPSLAKQYQIEPISAEELYKNTNKHAEEFHDNNTFAMSYAYHPTRLESRLESVVEEDEDQLTITKNNVDEILKNFK